MVDLNTGSLASSVKHSQLIPLGLEEGCAFSGRELLIIWETGPCVTLDLRKDQVSGRGAPRSYHKPEVPIVSWTVLDPWSNRIARPQQQWVVRVWGWAWAGAEGRNKFLYVASQTPMTHIFIQHVFSTTHSMPLGGFPKVNWCRGRNRGWAHRWAYENIVLVIWILKNHNLCPEKTVWGHPPVGKIFECRIWYLSFAC